MLRRDSAGPARYDERTEGGDAGSAYLAVGATVARKTPGKVDDDHCFCRIRIPHDGRRRILECFDVAREGLSKRIRHHPAIVRRSAKPDDRS